MHSNLETLGILSVNISPRPKGNGTVNISVTDTVCSLQSFPG